MLEVESPDLVSLCLPNEDHFATTLRVIESGYPLLVEKPLVFDLAEADRLLDEAAARNLFFAINFNHRYARPVTMAHDAINAGRLGAITFATWRFGGEIGTSTHPHANLIETQCHGFDMLEHLCGPIASVSAHMSSPTGGGHTTMAVALTFASGAVGSLVGSYDSSYAYPETHYVEVNGAAGRVQIVDTVKRFTHSTPGDEIRQVWEAGYFNDRDRDFDHMFELHLDDIVTALRRGERAADPRPSRPPRPPARPGMHPVVRRVMPGRAVKITGVTTHLVGNRWKNWLFVRVDTDEGIHGLGEGTLNGFCRTVDAAVRELEGLVVGHDPFAIESLGQRLGRDLYSEGGQIHGAAMAAIEVACWDIKGKALGVPLYELLGGLVRDRVPVYANGWYQVSRTPQAFADAATAVIRRGYSAMKFDPFGTAWRTQTQRQQHEAIDIVAAVRDAVGADVDLMIEGHNRFAPSTALTISGQLAPYRPAWFEEPVPHQHIAAIVHVARNAAVPIATGESLSSVQQFAELLSHHAVDILQPEPLSLGGLAPTKVVAGMAEAHYGMLAPHNAQGPVCSMISLHLGASTPNFYYLEAFEDFNEPWTRQIVVDDPFVVSGGYVAVNHRPGLGIDLDWDRLADHPYGPAHVLRLYEQGWERRDPQTEG